jgi:2-haloacid dehalogenase
MYPTSQAADIPLLNSQYASITSPPPPSIATILKSTLPRSIAFALRLTPSASSSSIPDLSPVYAKLAHLTPSANLAGGFKRLKEDGAKVLIITNGAEATTQGYVDQAGLEEVVDRVKSCDEVGLGKPFGKVYEMAHRACDQILSMGNLTGEAGSGERWFVAAHMWDLHAARKAG